jgi:hypothetical protein
VRRIIAGAVVLLLAAACSSGGDDSSTSTTATTTTLPQSATTTSLAPRTVTAGDIDVCSWLNEDELATVLEDPGTGVPTVTMPEDESSPVIFSGQCAWPDAEDPQLTLHYLAPTTAESGQRHLQDVLTLEPEVFAGGTVLPPIEVNGEQISFLADADGMVREAAVVKRSALLYLVVDQELDARDAGALDPYAELMFKALVRAPR